MDDYLHETAKWNTPHFDRWIIATTPDDYRTREVCRKFNLECVLSDDARRHGKPFNKGRLISRALQITSEDSWRLHIDSDIALPHGFRHLVQTADLQEDGIYGADRVDVIGWKKWQELQDSGFMNHSLDYHCRVQMPGGFRMGTRWAHPIHGYVPLGYFQLWSSQSDEWRGVRTRDYPKAHGKACRTDTQFSLLWDRHKRVLIPELVVAHLMTEDLKKGANWSGRKTKIFGPEWCEHVPKNIGS